MNKLENALKEWVKTIIPNQNTALNPLAGDASLRRYFRLQSLDETTIIMDCSAEKNALKPFLEKGKILSMAGVKTPTVHAASDVLGYALLEDLGDTVMLDVLTENNVTSLYQKAMNVLLRIQSCPIDTIEVFDKDHIATELSLFQDWFLTRYLQITLSAEEDALLHRTFHELTNALMNQPQVFMHRDFHSRNLMLTSLNNDIAVIDFQDAMRGPFTYDLVSLLKDCYIKWPAAKVQQWVHYFYANLPNTHGYTLLEFQRAFDLAGLQRHLKVLGIFCRLHFRDNKSRYLHDLPMVFKYTMACLEQYPELAPFYSFIKKRVQAPFEEKQSA